jgi:hypothetical protein
LLLVGSYLTTFVLTMTFSVFDSQDRKFTLCVAARDIARYKDLELAYKTVIENFIKIQEDTKARAGNDN